MPYIIRPNCAMKHDTITRKFSQYPNNLLPAATKLGQGNIFTSVCQEFCPRGGERFCLSACWDTPPSKPPRPGRPPDQADPPRTRQTPPGTRHHHTVYEQPVRILLECILVIVFFILVTKIGNSRFSYRRCPYLNF